MKLKNSQNILICPLEWGLGHAGRMIPLAARLREMNYNIYIGAGEEILSFFRIELPGINCLNFSGFNPGYSQFLPPYLSMLFKTPGLIYNSVLEHQRLKKIIREHSIDIVISDNRFGLWNKKIKTVYVTHMPLIPFPRPFRFLEFIGKILHRAIIKKYSLCFIPDLPGEINVTGRLSHNLKLSENTRYIGILSRFTIPVSSALQNQFNYKHITVILSGPEPQRSVLKQKLVEQLNDKETPVIILEGRPDRSSEPVRSGNIVFFNHLRSSEMKDLISGSDGIVSRSGYTTIMELISLGCNALLIPTPGQTEQEYLAQYLVSKGWFASVSQNQLSKGISPLSEKTEWAGRIVQESKVLLEKALKELSDKE